MSKVIFLIVIVTNEKILFYNKNKKYILLLSNVYLILNIKHSVFKYFIHNAVKIIN